MLHREWQGAIPTTNVYTASCLTAVEEEHPENTIYTKYFTLSPGHKPTVFSLVVLDKFTHKNLFQDSKTYAC